MATCSRRRLPTVLGTVVTAIVVVLTSFVPTAEATTMTVQVGFGGRHRPGADLLVQVDVGADRLLDGELRISSRNGPSGMTVVLPVEIAGGAEKRFVTSMPSVQQFQGSIVIELVDGSTVISSQQAQFVPEIEDELVGVLPTLAADAPATALLAVDLGDARLFPIDDALLAIGPGGVDALGTIVATSGDLAALGDTARVVLDAWIETGGTLIVDDASGPVAGFDVVVDDGPVDVGLGRITTTGGALASGHWDGVLQPTTFEQDPSGSGGLTGELTGEVSWFGGPIANSLARDAGFGLPPMAVVLPVMAGYVLLIGPIAWLVLRRMGRRGLLWVALPGLALAFTALIWAGGDRIRSSADDAHGTVIRIENGVAYAQTTILESSAGGSTASLEIPVGWRPLQTADFRFGFESTSSTVIRPALDTTRVEASLDAGDFVVLGASGPVPDFDEALSVTADSAAEGITNGTVTNNLDIELRDVAVFVGAQYVGLGTLDPGETADFRVSGQEADPRFGVPAEQQLWGTDPNGFVSGNDEVGVVNLALWAGYMAENTGRVRQPGTASVVAWTDELASPVDTAITSGRTAILARTSIAPAGTTLTDVAGARRLLRGAEQAGFNAGQFGFQVTSAWQFDVPSVVDTDALALHVPGNATRVDVWDGTAWRTVDEPDDTLYELPPEAISDGAIHVRISVNFDRQGLLGREFSVVTVDPGIDTSDALLSADAAADEEEAP